MAPGPTELLVFFATHGIFGLLKVMSTCNQPGCSHDWWSVNMEQTWTVFCGEGRGVLVLFLSLFKNPWDRISIESGDFFSKVIETWEINLYNPFVSLSTRDVSLFFKTFPHVLHTCLCLQQSVNASSAELNVRLLSSHRQQEANGLYFSQWIWG